MKLVVVDEYDAPEIIDVLTDGDLIVADHKHWSNLEEGDLVQVLGHYDYGTTCYLVIGVEPQTQHGSQYVRLTESFAA